jgi:hypothetical protein
MDNTAGRSTGRADFSAEVDNEVALNQQDLLAKTVGSDFYGAYLTLLRLPGITHMFGEDYVEGA